jgi:hypothetical protein
MHRVAGEGIVESDEEDEEYVLQRKAPKAKRRKTA